MARIILMTMGEALAGLSRNWRRAGLAMLGLTVSVAALVTIAGIGQGAQRMVERQVATMGENVVVVMPALQRVGLVRSAQGTAVTLTMTDALETQRKVSLIRDVCWGRRDPTQVIHEQYNWRLPVVGINPGCFSVRGWELEDGEPFTQVEMEQNALVAVLGQTAVERLYGDDREPVGSTIIIKRVPFRVIGVLRPKGPAPAGSDQDDIVFIPFSTAQKKVHGAKFYESVEAISFSIFEKDDIPRAVAAIRQILRDRHRLHDGQPDDFTVKTQLDLAEVYEGASRTLVQFLLLATLIASLVGGIGIMNILLVSVTERTREIGVRMAVGAKRWHILMQFMIEATALSLAGGCAGILVGVVGASLSTELAGWPTIISGTTVILAFVFSLAVGVFFGLYPAHKASRLNPIDALRYE